MEYFGAVNKNSYTWKNYAEFKEHGIGNITLIYDADLNVSSFNDILSIVEELKTINAEALVSVLNQSISRK